MGIRIDRSMVFIVFIEGENGFFFLSFLIVIKGFWIWINGFVIVVLSKDEKNLVICFVVYLLIYICIFVKCIGFYMYYKLFR